MIEKRPNVLLITSDQQHWNTLGCLNPELKTPTLNRMAAQGTLFSRAYCPNPTCTPTRASILTGQYPSQHGAYSLGTKLPESAHTLGEDFIRAGYATALIGKAHFQPLAATAEYPSLEARPILFDLDFWRKFDRRFYGFEHVELARNHVDEPLVGQHYALWLEENGCTNWRDYFQPPIGNNPHQRHTWQIPERFHYNTWIAERTNARLEIHAKEQQPFFLWSSFFDPHPPYLVPKPWDAMYDSSALAVPRVTPGEHERNPPFFRKTQEEEPDFSEYEEPEGNMVHGFHSHRQRPADLARDIAIYYGMVSMMDHSIGRILERLEALGLAENTLVVFASDHGHLFGQHGLIAKGPFHYEDLLKVPLLARWPGRIPAGRKSDALQSLVDLPVTLLRFCGLEVPRSMVGVDQSAVWTGRQARAREHVLVENRHQPTTVNLRTYIDARYKITVHLGREYGELFNLEEDPGEVNNLWAAPASAGLKQELLLKFLHAEMAREPLPMPRVSLA